MSDDARMPTQRADAAARRAQILDAADAVFGQHGVTAPLDLVVERAQVGRATLYRNFPDRTALVEALLQRTVNRIARQVQTLGDRDDALFEVLESMANRIVQSPALSDYWRAVDPDQIPIRAARETIYELLREPIARAIAAGLCRPDLETTDISLISGMLGAALRGKTRDERARLVTRALQLLRGGLRGPADGEG
ncbi:AcrR family transcriptional regulator [Stenotrophomonas rhizophila]